MKLFDTSEFEGLDSSQIQQKGNEIQRRFSQRRSYYHQIKNFSFINDEKWNELNKKIIEFDQGSFKAWNQQWDIISKQQNPSKYTTHFNKGTKIFDELEGTILYLIS